MHAAIRRPSSSIPLTLGACISCCCRCHTAACRASGGLSWQAAKAFLCCSWRASLACLQSLTCSAQALRCCCRRRPSARAVRRRHASSCSVKMSGDASSQASYRASSLPNGVLHRAAEGVNLLLRVASKNCVRIEASNFKALLACSTCVRHQACKVMRIFLRKSADLVSLLQFPVPSRCLCSLLPPARSFLLHFPTFLLSPALSLLPPLLFLQLLPFPLFLFEAPAYLLSSIMSSVLRVSSLQSESQSHICCSCFGKVEAEGGSLLLTSGVPLPQASAAPACAEWPASPLPGESTPVGLAWPPLLPGPPASSKLPAPAPNFYLKLR